MKNDDLMNDDVLFVKIYFPEESNFVKSMFCLLILYVLYYVVMIKYFFDLIEGKQT